MQRLAVDLKATAGGRRPKYPERKISQNSCFRKFSF